MDTHFVDAQLNNQTVLFLTIQFSISHLFALRLKVNSIWPTDRTLSGATILGQSRPGSNGNKEVFHIPQSSCITVGSPSDCLVSYPRYSVEVFYSCEKRLSLYFTGPTNLTEFHFRLMALERHESSYSPPSMGK